MDDVNKGIQKALILCLSGIRLKDIHALPEVQTLMERGAVVELDPSPITGPQTQHYQVLSGRLPACFGFFDTLMPLCRFPDQQKQINGYTVVETNAGRNAAPKLLPDLLRAADWRVEYKETVLSALVSYIRDRTPSVSSSATCIIVKCIVETPAPEISIEAIREALGLALSWVGESGLLALVSDIQPALVKRFVNVNNFLAEMDLIERDEQNGLINWPDSLAYYVGHGQLWINLLGRDPQGIVHPQDEYEEVCDTLVKALPVKLRDPETGAQVIERVYRKEELYSSDYLFCAPDLIIVFKPGYAPSRQSTRLGFDEGVFTAPTPGEMAMAGAHPSTVNGFLLASAPVLASGVSVPEHAPLTTVTPTLLHALGVEDVGVDSPAISAVFSPSYLETHPIRTHVQSEELSGEDEELVINRLRDLGYV
jgi:hypothetical protein